MTNEQQLNENQEQGFTANLSTHEGVLEAVGHVVAQFISTSSDLNDEHPIHRLGYHMHNAFVSEGTDKPDVNYAVVIINYIRKVATGELTGEVKRTKLSVQEMLDELGISIEDLSE